MSAPATNRVLCRAAFLLVAVGPGTGSITAQDAERPVITWYGYTKLDASWDQNVVSAGNYARWVVSPDLESEHARFNMTGRQTRIGMHANSAVHKANVRGTLEFDFYGGGAENKNWLQVRHAYVEATWPSGWTLLAGQTSDVVSPLAPGTLNYVVAWWSGNVGYRRPQLRVSKRTSLGSAALTVTAAASRTIGDDWGISEPGDSGADSGVPTVQGRIGLSRETTHDGAAVGLYAHRGREVVDEKVFGERVRVPSEGVGVDVRLPVGPLVLSGESWLGSNLDDYLGGVGQGVILDATTAHAVDGAGGWVQLAYSPGAMAFALGGGVDDPDDADLPDGARARNISVWATVRRDIGAGLSHGIEVSRWITDYVGASRGTSTRVQLSIVYAF